MEGVVMRKKFLLAAVLLVMLSSFCSVKEPAYASETETEITAELCQMLASYQDSLTNRIGAEVRVLFENEWTNPVSNGRAIADCSKAIRGISIGIGNCEGEGSIAYQVHEVQGAWLAASENGQKAISGNSSINAVRVSLEGSCAELYNVYTKVYQNNHWCEWGLNGAATGDENGEPITGICVEIRSKEEGVPAFFIRDAETNQKMIALTFDDSPSDKETDLLLDLLKQYDACATFFVVGESVNENRIDTMKRIVAEGSEIGIHTYGHDNLTEITKDEVAATCAECSWVIESTTGVRPVVLRAPGGNCNAEALDVLRTLNLPNVLWSVDSQDWKKKDSETIAGRILKDVTEGSIILAHDVKESTVEAMKTVIPALAAEGYRFVTVSELFAYNGGICAGKQYSQTGEADEPANEEEGFNDICIFSNDDEKVDFCGVDFDGSEQTITLNICCNNFTGEIREFRIGNLEINGESHEETALLGALEKDGAEVFEFLVSSVPGIAYSEIADIRFAVLIDDENHCELAKSQTVHVLTDTPNESFQATAE